MSDKLLIAPPPAHRTAFTSSTAFSAPSAPGVYDTLRSALNPTHPSSLSPHHHDAHAQPSLHLQSSHPLESRLAQWDATQTQLKHSLLRRQFGLAAPLQREMELLTVRHGDAVRPSLLGGGAARSVHEDILLGKDWELGWEDVFTGDDFMPMADFHSEMEYRMGMNW